MKASCIRYIYIMGAIVTTLAFSACSHEATAPQPVLKQLPRSLSVNELRVRDGSNRFAFGLLHEENRNQAGQSVFLSPLSASYALGMATTGAAGATLDSMRATLGLDGLSVDELGRSYQSLTTLLLSLDSSVDLRIANGIWYRRGLQVEPAFTVGAQQYFGATVQPADFDARTVDAINGWADHATNGKITKVIDGFGDGEVMLIANAIYFKGSWATRFDSAQTSPRPFTLTGGGTIQVPMMHKEIDASYYQDASMQVVDLPYGRGAYAMTIFLPPVGTDIDKFVANLDGTSWARAIGGLQPGKVDVTLPKFRLTWGDSLNRALQALGMGIAYACDFGADFSGISRAYGPRLCISDVQQKTFIDVDEEGTEAAAVTTVGVVMTSLPSVPSVRVDHPFVVAIRERLSGTILFLGKIARPPQG